MMDVTVTTVKDTKVVAIVGEIDGSTAPKAGEQILDLVEPDVKIILDLSGVTYMSSAGLRMLLLTYRTVNGKGGRVAVVGLSGELEDTMSMTGFLDFFDHFDTLETGLAHLA
jgi:anti-sigma B factor antagonist